MRGQAACLSKAKGLPGSELAKDLIVRSVDQNRAIQRVQF